MKYRVFALLGLLAISASSLLQAQDYDDIYYDANKTTTTKTKVMKPAKTDAVYGEVPEKYQVAVQDNYRVERDVDEYNRRGEFDPEYEVDINGDTIYEEAFANTRRIERFYNPDIVILSDDEDLVEIYYDESPSINLIIGSEWGYGSYYSDWYGGWYGGWYNTYYPWYHGYRPWYYNWHSPYWAYYWSSPYWHWGWHYSPWYRTGWGWNSYPWYDNWTVRPTGTWAHRHGFDHPQNVNVGGSRVGFANNRNNRPRVGAGSGTSRNTTGLNGSRNSTSGNRRGYATSRSGNMSSRNSQGVASRSSGAVSRSYSGSRSSSSSSNGGYRSSSSSGGYRSGSSSYGGSHSSGSSSGGSISSGGSHGGSSGGSHGGSSGGGGRRR